MTQIERDLGTEQALTPNLKTVTIPMAAEPILGIQIGLSIMMPGI